MWFSTLWGSTNFQLIDYPRYKWLLCFFCRIFLQSWIDFSFMSLYSLSLNPCKLLILAKSFCNKFHNCTTCFVKNHFFLLILNLRATNFIWCSLFFCSRRHIRYHIIFAMPLIILWLSTIYPSVTYFPGLQIPV